jgi:drug/metabolite transporter (DMT)-like permease
VRTQYLAGLLLLGALWGASFLFIKLGLESFPPLTLVSLRLLGAAVLLYALLRMRGLRLPTTRRGWGDLVFIGVAGTLLPWLLITWGEQHISSGLASILNATTPLFSILLAYVWTREEQLSPLRTAGVLLGFVGVVVAVGPDDLNLASAGTQGELAVLGAAALYGVAAIYGRRAFRGMPPLVPATGQMITGSIALVPIALLVDGPPTSAPTAAAIGGVVGLTLIGTVFAYILYYWLLERLGAARASMVTYLLPPFALLYGWLWLSEPLHANTLLGLGLVVAGILVANGVLSLRRRSVAVTTT